MPRSVVVVYAGHPDHNRFCVICNYRIPHYTSWLCCQVIVAIKIANDFVWSAVSAAAAAAAAYRPHVQSSASMCGVATRSRAPFFCVFAFSRTTDLVTVYTHIVGCRPKWARTPLLGRATISMMCASALHTHTGDGMVCAHDVWTLCMSKLLLESGTGRRSSRAAPCDMLNTCLSLNKIEQTPHFR